MAWPVSPWGTLVFFGVLVVFWAIGAFAARRFGRPALLLAFISGSDNRLSLSRLQAFLWFFIIVAAFVAAMVVSTKVGASKWVGIPTELLQLAGIAVGSGVFSSLIATQSGEAGNIAVVTDAKVDKSSLKIEGQNLGSGARVTLDGKDLRVVSIPASQPTSEALQADLSSARFSPSKTNLKLVVDTTTGRVSYSATVAVANGPTPVRGTLTSLTLGAETTYYEFTDLFRDDKNPQTLDLMKFQMFGWTLIALVLYVGLFLSHLTSAIVTLPTVDPSIVLLTGLSHSGYLAGKGASALQSS